MTCLDASTVDGVYLTLTLPCGLPGSLCTLHPVRSAFASYSDATLGTGGGLGLTRLGLSPYKKRQAFLGALTPNCPMQALEHNNMRQDDLNMNKNREPNCHCWLAFETNDLLSAVLFFCFYCFDNLLYYFGV